MAEEDNYKDEIQVIAEKLTSTTTIESVLNPVQRKGRLLRTSNSTKNGIMTYDGSSEGNKSNVTATLASVTAAEGDAAGNDIIVVDADVNVNVSVSVNADVDANADDSAGVVLDADTGANAIANNSMVRNLPELNLPEKILLVIDTVREENGTQFKFGTGAKYSPLMMIKRAIEMFIGAKSTIQRTHVFALMTLNSEDSQWVCDFTSNVKTIVSRLNTITEDVSENKRRTYDFGALFEKIQAQLPLPEKKDDTTVAASFTTRVVLIYTRSNCIPKFHRGREHLDNLMKNPYFFLDVLYVHETPGKENECEEIYNEIMNLEMTNFSYIMEVGRNAAKLHDGMAKLLAHPLQRPPQLEASYKLCSATISQQVHTNV